MSQGSIEAGAIPGSKWLPALAMLPVLIGLLTLFGWSASIEVLTSIRPGLTPMNPMTAVGLIAAGLTAILYSRGGSRGPRPLSFILMTIGAAKLLEAGLGWHSIDNVLFAGSMSADVFGPGRMAPNTAGAFVLLGLAGLLLGRSKRFSIASQLLSACVALIALFALVGYMFGVAPLHTYSALRPMAVHTAVGIFISAICLASVERFGIAAILRDGGPAGAMARSVLPIAVLIPIAIGGARLWGERAGFYDTEVGVSIQVVANVTLTCGLLAFAIFMINRSDKARLAREAALRRSQEFAQVGHVHWSEPDPRPVWSEEAFRIHGLSAGVSAPSIREWSRLVHREDCEGFDKYLEAARLTGIDEEWRGRIVRPSGEIRYVRVHLTADRAQAASHPSLFGIVSDMTDLEQARRQAEDATRAKAAFLANMSHEIRTPLNGVLGFSELLMTAGLDDEDHAHASLVHQSAGALLHLLNGILDFSKIEAGSMDISPEPTRLPELLQDCVALVEPAARAKGVAIFLHVHDDVPPWALIDGLRLRQVALNLLGNAVKFTEKGFVALEARGDGKDNLVIQIHDTGVGIAADRQHAIFGEFVQADAAVTRRFGGTGLGLSISRRLAELMGGSLTLESQAGRGTKVELNLPMEVASGSARPDGASPPTGATSAHILLVEDDELNQRLATTILEKLGHQVELATDGLEAVAAMQRFERGEAAFDMIFMDIQLPRFDGLEATRRIRTLGPRSKGIPIIGLSANAYASDVAACLDAGMNDHLPKPFSIDSLSRATGRWSGRDKARAAARPCPDTVASLVPMFLAQCRAAAELVAELERALDAGASPAELASEVGRAAHKLAGTAASFGHPELGRAAAGADEYLAAWDGTTNVAAAKAFVSKLAVELAETLGEVTSEAA